jgi:uncharacterized protein YndB with AHSA1/START domain
MKMTPNKPKTTISTPSDREFVMERIFDAPRELVWQVWTQPEHLKQWWGPKDWTLPVCKVDLRPGGVWHYCMRGPNGEESWGKTVYREIVAPTRLVYSDSFSDEAGNVVAGMPEMVITLTFEELDGKTKVTARTQFASAADLQSILDMGVAEGATETWDRLERYLATI